MSVLLGQNWKALPATERAVYVEAAKKIKEDFKAEHPECVLRPPFPALLPPTPRPPPPHALPCHRTRGTAYRARSAHGVVHRCTRAREPSLTRVRGPHRYRYARSTRTKGKKRKGGGPQRGASGDSRAASSPTPPPPPPAPPPPSHAFLATPARQGASSSAPPEALSLHALALAGASLASPPSAPSPPPGSFKTCSFKPFGSQSSPAAGGRATVQRGAVSPVSSELSMLDQLCVVADGAPPPHLPP